MKNKKSNVNFVKTFLSTLIVIVLIAATVAIGFFSSGFRNWTKEEWQNVWDETFEDPTPEQDGESVTDENGNELDQTAVNPMPSRLNITSSALALANGDHVEISIYATVRPSSAQNKSVDWSIKWEDGSTTDIDQYLTITPTYDGSNVISVKCYKPFTKDAIITVTTRDGGYTDECVVSFIGIPSSMEISTSATKNGDYYSLGTSNNYTFEISLDNIFESVGITPNYSIQTGASGSLYFCTRLETYSGTTSFSDVTLKSINEMKDKFFSASVSGNTLSITVKDKVLSSYYSSSSYDSSMRNYTYYDSYLPYSTASTQQYITEMIYNRDNVDSVYFYVDITEQNSNLKTRIQFKIVSGVSGVNISESEITY